jgi:hypothetical protein
MQSGLFAVEFIANNNQFGTGVAVVANGAVNGGDSGYYYQGHFDYYENEIKAAIEVRHHSGPANSVMGPLNNFALVLTGQFTEDNFVATGGIPNIPGLKITIRGRKLADLSE